MRVRPRVAEILVGLIPVKRNRGKRLWVIPQEMDFLSTVRLIPAAGRSVGSAIFTQSLTVAARIAGPGG